MSRDDSPNPGMVSYVDVSVTLRPKSQWFGIRNNIVPFIERSSVQNRLLLAMDAADFATIASHLELVTHHLRQNVIRADAEITDLYFPETGFISVVTAKQAISIEIGLIGTEGLAGAGQFMLGVNRSPYDYIIQMQGQSLRIAMHHLKAAVDRSATLRRLLLSYVHTAMIQTSQTAFANAAYKIDARLARWLLMCRDRVPNDDFSITHEFLAMMLGVRRAGVTEALHVLEGGRLIKAHRGQIVILDRKGLQAVAGDSYGLAEAEYARLIPLAQFDGAGGHHVA